MANVAVLIDTEDWTRWAEVERFAYYNGLTIEQALRRLVNSGLSHLL
jgi:hypothetical protein